ncbi:MAG TPA: HAMP domain-containing sensor histidine kinase [Polyangiaceae bacterium]|nr:HAMP domain-containing sensor histidine kinase [Polyangiaceae bacterium]
MQRRKRLAHRVVVSTIASAAIGGALTASLAILAVDRLVADHGDQRLMGATVTLEGEIEENRAEIDPEPLTETVDDENAETATSGIRMAIFKGNQRIAGDRNVPMPPNDTCETYGAVGNRERACGRRYGEWLLAASQLSDQAALRWLYIGAGIGALLLSGLIGALASLRLTRWALRPLFELTLAVRALPARGAVREQLGPPSDCEEIQDIRAALANLIERHDALLKQAHRFAADAAHELRTPLTMIAGELELLAEEDVPSESRRALLTLRQRTARLAALVERLLVLASPLSEQEHAFDTLALADLLAEVVAEFPPEQRVRVHLHLEGEGLTRGEPSLLRSLFVNAIENALKFSGSAAVDVVLSEVSPGTALDSGRRMLQIDVRDQGAGVPRAERRSVFEPLYRADPALAPGHGLGLALIGHIVRAHEGSAQFVDTSAGACLRLLLPVWTAEQRSLPPDQRVVTPPE